MLQRARLTARGRGRLLRALAGTADDKDPADTAPERADRELADLAGPHDQDRRAVWLLDLSEELVHRERTDRARHGAESGLGPKEPAMMQRTLHRGGQERRQRHCASGVRATELAEDLPLAGDR